MALGEPLRGHYGILSIERGVQPGWQTHRLAGSWDNTLRLWDAEKGVALGEPLRGHTDSVLSVAFSLGSWTLRLWDAESCGAGEPLRGHTN